MSIPHAVVWHDCAKYNIYDIVFYMKKEMKIILKSFKPLHDAWMRNPEYKKAYDDLEIEFALIRAILEQRERKGITQKQLAERVGTKQSAIARFESGNANPTLAFVKKLSQALDLHLTVKR